MRKTWLFGYCFCELCQVSWSHRKNEKDVKTDSFSGKEPFAEAGDVPAEKQTGHTGGESGKEEV